MLIFFVSPACHSSCASCWGSSVSQCTLCPGGLLLHQGQCVEACGEGLYAQDYTCHSESLNTLIKYPVKKTFLPCPQSVTASLWCCLSSRPDCHPSCRSCVGPLASDCLRCLKPEEALLPQSSHLQHSVCTAGCPTRSFLDDMQTCRGECIKCFILLPV